MTEFLDLTVTSIQLAKSAVAYIMAVKNAPDDVRNLGERVQLGKTALEDLQDLFNGMPPGDQEGSGLSEQSELIGRRIERYGNLSDEIHKYMKSDKVQDYISRTSSAFHRLRFPTVQKKLLEQTTEAEALQNNFSLILQVGHSRDLQKLKHESSLLKSMVRDLQSTEDAQHGRAIYQACIERLPFDSKMATTRQDHRANSKDSIPDWIEHDETYKTWISGAGNSRLLWAFGEPGSGKTCIASFLADRLQAPSPPSYETATSQLSDDTNKATESSLGELADASISSPSTACAIFYCNYRSLDQQDPDTILKALSRQLLEQLRDKNPQKAFIRVKHFDDRMSSLQAAPSETIDALLNALASDLEQTYIIIDALDENSSHYKKLVHRLSQMSAPDLKIFVTSRDGNDGSIQHEAETYKALQIRINPGDEAIRSYVKGRLHRIACKDSSEPLPQPALLEALSDVQKHESIKQQIVKAASGNFLCAQLQITALKDIDSTRELDDRLADLPNELEPLFKDAFERIQTQPSRTAAERGNNTLLWAIYGRRALTIPEIQHALAVTPRTTNFRRRIEKEVLIKESTKFSPQALIESTRYFLSIDSETITIQIHKAVQDYCDRFEIEQLYFKNPHLEMANTCIRYLDQEDLEERCSTENQWHQLTGELRFLEYAAQSWGWHLGKGTEEKFLESSSSVQMLFRLLSNTNTLNCLAIAVRPTLEGDMWNNSTWQTLKDKDKVVIPAIHLLTYFNLPELAGRWLDKEKENVDETSQTGHTALWLACRQGQVEVAQELLARNADPAREIGNKRFCLAAAAYRGHTKVVKLLLRHNGKTLVRQCNWYGRSPLTDAAYQGFLEIVQMIYQHGPEELLKRDENGNNALHEAAWSGHAPVIYELGKKAGVKDLLQQEAGRWKEKPIHSAARNCQTKAVKAVLDIGADPEARQSEEKTPLHLALQKSHDQSSEIVAMLIPRTNLKLQDIDGMTFLHTAAHHDSRHLPSLLPHTPKDLLHTPDKKGRIPLIAVARDRRKPWVESMIHLLKAATGDISAQEAEEIYRVSLETKNAPLLRQLFDSLSDPKILIKHKENHATILHETARTGSLELVKVAYEKSKGFDLLEKLNEVGQTPLLDCSGRGHTTIVKYFISLGANINYQGGAGRTALHWAVDIDNPEMADLLLSHNIDYNLEDNQGRKALSLASATSKCSKLPRARLAHRFPNADAVREIECVHSKSTSRRTVTGDEQTKRELIEEQAKDFSADKVDARTCRFLVSDPIPANAKIPLFRIAVSVTARDQGWSDHLEHNPRDRGSFAVSNTWFEIHLIRNGKTMRWFELTRNKIGLENAATYTYELDTEKGHKGNGSKWQRPQDHEEVRELIRRLRPGDRVAVVAKAQFLRWLNVVEGAELRVFYKD